MHELKQGVYGKSLDLLLSFAVNQKLLYPIKSFKNIFIIFHFLAGACGILVP